MVSEGCTVYCGNKKFYECNDFIQAVEIMFTTTGKFKHVTENLINPIGALSGSGPAYVSYHNCNFECQG